MNLRYAALLISIFSWICFGASFSEIHAASGSIATVAEESKKMKDEKIQAHLILIGRSGKSLTDMQTPLLGKQAIPYQQDPQVTAELVEILAERLRLETERPKEASTTLLVRGTKKQFEKIFGAPLIQKEDAKRGIEWQWGGVISIPDELSQYVSGVVLPTRPDFPASP